MNTAATSVVDTLLEENWRYEQFFDPPGRNLELTVEGDSEAIIAQVALNDHPFFVAAESDPYFVTLWVTQELVTTNAFSQIVLLAASKINNVHQRAILTDVAYGEHGRFRRGIAKAAHPWLLEKLRESLSIDRSIIAPVKPTIDFICRLHESLLDPLRAVAFIGIGNERLIEPEYRAMEACFKKHFPNSTYKPFLNANIVEDERHSKLCYELADSLIRSSEERSIFLTHAADAAQSRVHYFDELLQFGKTTIPV